MALSCMAAPNGRRTQRSLSAREAGAPDRLSADGVAADGEADWDLALPKCERGQEKCEGDESSGPDQALGVEVQIRLDDSGVECERKE